MIEAKIIKIDINGKHCDNSTCQHLSEYNYNILGNVYFIKHDSTCLVIMMDGGVEYYCNGCIDEIYNKLKPVLDRKLWVFE